MGKFIYFVIFMSLSVNLAQAKLLDKIVAVLDDNVVTLSQIKRVGANMVARRNISPQIYPQEKITSKSLARINVQRFIIRAKLEELGYIINDDQVEGQISDTEKRLNLTRENLLQFLRGNAMTFQEYFELIRESIEYNIFNSRIIRPLISVTEQEIKNFYFSRNKNSKTINFVYDLVDFYVPKNSVSKDKAKRLPEALKKYQANGVLPKEFSGLETDILGRVEEDGLSPIIQRIVKKTPKDGFSKAVIIGDNYHVFFVKNREIVESEEFKEVKPKIRELLFRKAAKEVKQSWFQREEEKHYIKYFL